MGGGQIFFRCVHITLNWVDSLNYREDYYPPPYEKACQARFLATVLKLYKIAIDNKFSQTDKRFSKSDNSIIYIMFQGGITCGAIDEPRISSEAIDKRVIINFCDKNVVIERFRDKNGAFILLL